jgi:long-subunit acyl-CoA synthetase (AMP-forming)
MAASLCRFQRFRNRPDSVIIDLAMKSDSNMPRYPKLSAEQVDHVLDDLKEHLKVAKPAKNLSHEEMADQLGREMVESIKKRPPVH